MELRIRLTPKQIEFDRAIGATREVLYGGSKGGGKSFGLRMIMLKRRFQYANSIGYIFRKSFPELEANHISPLFEQFPQLRAYYNESKKTLRLPNGSQLRFAYAESARALKKFQGREIHDLGIEEAGQWLFEEYDELRSCNRSSVPGVEPRVLLTANPGGPGHKWLRRLFIDRSFEPGERPEDYKFIPARVYDNPALMAADPRYAERLAAIKNPTLRRAFLDGDWDIVAGQYFDKLSRSIHLVRPFEIPRHWPRFGGYDYGFNHPAAFTFFAADQDGNVYLHREIAEPKLDIPEQAALVLKSYGADETRISVWEAGHDCWAKKSGNDPTIAEKFAKLGIYLKRANIDRKLGAAHMREYLSYRTEAGKDGAEKRVGPRLFIFETCRKSWDCLTRMQHDPDNVEDVLKVDATEADPFSGDDLYDSARMALMSRPSIAIAPKKPQSDRYARRTDSSGELPWTVR